MIEEGFLKPIHRFTKTKVQQT